VSPAGSDRPVKVLVLADLGEALGAAALSADAVLAWELANALAALRDTVGGVEVDLVARRGSEAVLPLITADPDELAPPGPTSSDDAARQDALYTQMVLAGVADGYDVVHALAPLVAPIQVLVSAGRRVCQTVTMRPAHLSAQVGRIVPRQLLHLVALGTQGQDPLRAAPPPVDLNRFQPGDAVPDAYLVWSGAGGPDAHTVGREAAESLGMTLRRLDEADPAALLRRSAGMVHTPYPAAPVDIMWPVRALACGLPVVSWEDRVLQRYCDASGLASFVAPGDPPAIAAGFSRLAAADGRDRRRATTVAWSGYRAVAARYREIYEHLAGTSR